MVASCVTAPFRSPAIAALRRVWETLTPESCPYDYNFHLHTHCSDGRLSPQTLIAEALEVGLKGLAITDHHSVQGYLQAQQWLSHYQTQHPQASLPRLWSGVEITAELLETEVHILGYGFEPTHPALAPYLQGDRPRNGLESAEFVIKALHQAGGLVVLAHPARYRQPASRLIPQAVELGIDGLEAFYAYGNPKPWVSSEPQMEEICYFSEIYGLLKTCGTDSHGPSILCRL
jgi:predicted metal-dependent phosphoesterase TrpH